MTNKIKKTLSHTDTLNLNQKEKQTLKLINELKQTTNNSLKTKNQCIHFYNPSLESQIEQLNNIIQLLIPWRKGPFYIQNQYIDTEWDSSIKWYNIQKHFPKSLKDKNILDIGCNNGYFMFQLLTHYNFNIVEGIDPVTHYALQFHFLSQFLPTSFKKKINFFKLGHEQLHLLTNQYDLILCMGILYHTTDPIGLLRRIKKKLKPQGKLILETQGIKASKNMILFPEKKYANAKGMWFIPTASAVYNMLKRSGYQAIELFDEYQLSCDEQKSTLYSPCGSLNEGLDKNNSNKTVEGYPAPWRFYFIAH